MISVSEAESLIARHVPPAPTLRVPLAQCAGAVLHQDVGAERDQPPFDRAMMDGIAIVHESWLRGRRAFRVQATLAAGAPAPVLDDDAACIGIMTGAVVPQACDCIVPIEQVRMADGVATVLEAPTRGQFIHPRASDRLQGATLLTRGTRVGAAEMAVLASAGLASADVAAAPRIGVIATGDELVDADRPVAPWQIRRSNDFALAACLYDNGFGDVTRAHLSDDPEALAAGIGAWLARCDVLVLAGGVSMGQRDAVPAVLAAHGVERVFHRVAQRPGRPMWFGRSDGCVVFGLPGNPVSGLVCLVRYVVPALWRAAGVAPAPREHVTLSEPVRREPGLTRFVPVCLEYNARMSAAVPVLPNNSGDFVALAGTTGVVELDRGAQAADGGVAMPLYRWRGLMT